MVTNKQNNISKRTLSSVLVIAMIISMLSGISVIRTAKAASADETRVLKEQEKINSVLTEKKDYTNWIKRYTKYENGTYSGRSGLCTWCAMRDLINRRLAQDSVNKEKNLLSFKEIARIIVLNEYAHAGRSYTSEQFEQGYREVEYASDGNLSAIFIKGYNENCNLEEVLWGNYPYNFGAISGSYKVEKVVAQGDLKQRKETLRQLIDKHPEGVMVYYNGGKDANGNPKCHGFLLIGYKGEGESTQFYAHDTGNGLFGNGKLYDLADVYVATKHEGAITNPIERANAVIGHLDYYCYISDANSQNTSINPDELNLDVVSIGLEYESPIPLNTSCNINGSICGSGITKVEAYVQKEDKTIYTRANEAVYNPSGYTKIDVRSSEINKIAFKGMPEGNYTLFVVVHGRKTSKEYQYPFTKGNPPSNNSGNTQNNSTLTFDIMVDGKTNDGNTNNITLKKNYGCKISGTIQGTGVNYAVAKVLKNNQTLQTATANASAGKIIVEDSGINANIHFASLAVGDYKLEVTVYDANGKTLATKRVSFSVSLSGSPSVTTKKTENGITIDLTGFATTLTKGNIYHIPGTITSTAGIKSIKARVYDTRSGQYGYPSQIEANDTNPKTNPYNLKYSLIDTNLSFGRLTAGDYYIFEVIVTDKNNKTCKLGIPLVVR